MHDQSARMARLVDDLMSLSRIEMHEHTVPTARVDVAQIVQYVAETLQIKAGKKGMTFKIDLPDRSPLVLGEPDELTRVFQNLMDNAIKYGRARSPIEIRIRHEPGPLPGAPAALAIVKHIVNHHRGALHVGSTLGQGSTFTVRLPAPPSAEA